MFGKIVKRELIRYVRSLWPFAIAVVATSVLACVIVLTDKNPVEATGTITGIAFFAIAALVFLMRGLVHAYTSFHKNLSTVQDETATPLQVFCAQIAAFMIYIVFSALFLFGGVSAFAWESVGKMFSAFDTEWIYFLEFVLYLIITTLTIYLIPTAWITVLRFSKQKNWRIVLSMIVGGITLYLCVGNIIVEVLLLNHSASTDMPLVWGTTVTLLAIFVLVDVGMFLTTYRTLKTSLINKTIDK